MKLLTNNDRRICLMLAAVHPQIKRHAPKPLQAMLVNPADGW